ncbi:hypothetical protein Droror1_Dr00025847 [Drosera rotundifolia]
MFVVELKWLRRPIVQNLFSPSALFPSAPASPASLRHQIGIRAKRGHRRRRSASPPLKARASYSPNLSHFHNLILTMSAIPLSSFIWNFIIKLKVRIYDREPSMVIKANVKSETFPRLTCSHRKSLTPVVAKISIAW